MIRFDQRQLDVQGTEKVFKKVVHPGQNIRLVDKDGIPLKAPNSSTLSRLRSQYVLSPRGVPTKRSNHSYSGQLAQSKLHTVVNSLDTSTQPEMMSYSSVHNYNGYFRPYSSYSRLSSAPSSQHYPSQRYMPGNLTPKKRAFGSGPPRSVKSMPLKSASTQRSRFLTSAATTTDQMSGTDLDGDKSNDSPQGKRLEKEWSALSQCRALKRSSEIVSHRVDRMYFMTGSKLRLQSKYLVEDDDLQQLRELTQARASSRQTRTNRMKKGDIYRPDISAGGDKMDGLKQVNGTDGTNQKQDSLKINGKKKPPGPPESPTIKQTRSSKSPLAGWAGTEVDSKDPSMANENVHKEILHEEVVNGEVEGDADVIPATNGDGYANGEHLDEKENVDSANNQESMERKNDENEPEKEVVKEKEAIKEQAAGKELTSGKVNGVNVDEVTASGEKEREANDIVDGVVSVHEQDDVENADIDGDKTVVKGEDYLDKLDQENHP